MRTCALLLVGCVGCDVTLGLHHFEGETPRVTGHLIEHLVTYGTDFAPVLGQRFYPSTDVTMSVTLDDGSTPPVSYTESDGSFAFDRVAAGQPYRLHIVPADLGTIDYELATDAPTIGFQSLSRLDRMPVTLPTSLKFMYGVLPGFALITSTGVATTTNPQISNTGSFTFEWQTASSLTGPLGLLDASKNDRLYYTEYADAGMQPGAYSAITQFASVPITMTNGVGQTVGGALTQAIPNTCAHLVALRDATLAHWLADAPHAYMAGADWTIFATPSRTLGSIGAVILVLANQGTPATDVDITPSFFNPFPGTQLLASISAGGNFAVQLPGAASILFTDITRTSVPLDVSSPSCLVNNATPTSAIAIPRSISLDGTLLDHDDQQLSLGSSDHVVEWTAAAGTVDHASVSVSELTAPGGVTALESRYVTITTLGKATLPAALFVSGHTYNIVVENRVGYDAASGDLDTVHYPVAMARTSSFTFRAM